MFLSFVVPVYNAAQYLPECLDSLLAQDISDYEIICVNDGSRDASPEILRQYAAEHGNIRVINKENGGVVSARNAGLSAAQGDFIWFVDADDFLLPNILGFLKDKAAETACDRLIVGGYQFTDRLTDEEIALSRQMKLPINSQWYDSVVWRSLLRREFLLENGLNFRYPELTHGEDGLYMYEVGLCAPKSVEIKLALYCYREHSGSAETTVSLENYHKKIRSYIRISEILLGYYRDGRQDPTTADKLMVFLWFTLYVTASLPRKDAAAILRQLRQKGLYPFHRPPQCENVVDKIAEEMFYILFMNRDFLLYFNHYMSRTHEVNFSRIHMPEWVKRAVFYRDRGRCVLCGKDLSGQLAISGEREIHYDHMVSLEQGGMNDVTNIQLLCSSCNLSKGTFSATSNIYQNWYDMNKG